MKLHIKFETKMLITEGVIEKLSTKKRTESNEDEVNGRFTGFLRLAVVVPSGIKVTSYVATFFSSVEKKSFHYFKKISFLSTFIERDTVI